MSRYQDLEDSCQATVNCAARLLSSLICCKHAPQSNNKVLRIIASKLGAAAHANSTTSQWQFEACAAACQGPHECAQHLPTTFNRPINQPERLPHPYTPLNPLSLVLFTREAVIVGGVRANDGSANCSCLPALIALIKRSDGLQTLVSGYKCVLYI